MPKFSITPKQLPGALDASEKNSRLAVQKGAYLAANRGRTLLVHRSRKLANDRGIFANAWTVVPAGFKPIPGPWAYGNKMMQVVNRAPYAGVIELGARPHPVSDVGILNIERWVKRNIVAFEEATHTSSRSGGSVKTRLTAAQRQRLIQSVAMGIVWKLRHKGQAPKYVVQGALDKLQKYLMLEVRRMLKKAAATPPPAAAGA